MSKEETKGSSTAIVIQTTKNKQKKIKKKKGSSKQIDKQQHSILFKGCKQIQSRAGKSLWPLLYLFADCYSFTQPSVIYKPQL